MAGTLKSVFVAAILAVVGGMVEADEPQVWSGEDVEFVKADYADWRMASNQDRITPGVWLTRADKRGLFNYVEDLGWDTPSPQGTEWAYGSAADWATLQFRSWYDWHNDDPPSSVGQDAVLHLLDLDVYVDIKFLSWTSSDNGGGCSYERATEGVPGEKVWTGAPTTFTKADYADFGLAANQDRIADGVWITRRDKRGLFNIAREAGYEVSDEETSPRGTEWAWGTTADLPDLAFVSWRSWYGRDNDGFLDKSAVLHILEGDLYIDIRFLSWTSNNNGGGFSYERSTEGTPGEKVWTGAPTTFTKANYADWNLEANQDRITDDVWITRQDSRGLFNVVEELSYNGNSLAYPGSPYNTEWAYGSAADWETLHFKNWINWHGGDPQSTVGKAAVLHLVQEDVYIDIEFLTYVGGGSNGSFSYERATEGVPGEKVWSGAPTTFTRPSSVDWRDPANQDRITPRTWITRQNTQGLFNAAFERGYESSSEFQSPVLTEWASGTAADWASLSFDTWESWKPDPTPGIVGVNAVLHLMEEDVYLDVKFLSWKSGGGGGFSYERATEGVPGEKVWTGTKVTFTKADGADVGLAANQDRITDTVWITRRDNGGIFNAAREPGYEFGWHFEPGDASPIGTEWATGTAADRETLSFFPWRPWTRNWHNAKTPDVVGNSAVLHLIEEDVYIDVLFSFWSSNDNGGGFTYTRATEGVPGETVWSGPPVEIAKANGADPIGSADRITDMVWFARGDNQGPFNPVMEYGWEDPIGPDPEGTPPTGTEWAYGRAADRENLTFRSWIDWHDHNPLETIGKPAVVHLIAEDIYLDITFRSWTSNDRGGGFSYTRGSYRAPLGPLKAAGKVNFAAADGDSFRVKGEIDLGESFSPAGKTLVLDAGGVAATFTLDGKGKGTTGDGKGKVSLKFSRKTGTWKYSISLKGGSFANAWADEGMIDENIAIPVQCIVRIEVDGSPFAGTGYYTWKAKKGRAGSFK